LSDQLADRREIDDVLYRYAYALDSRDWDLLKEGVFTADASADFLDHGIMNGIDEIIGLVSGVLTGLDVSQHLITNPLAEVDGDSATAKCYLHAQHVFAGAPGGDQFIVAGTYEDELTRTATGWRISKRALQASWVAGNPEVFTAAAERLAASR
jgi:SnoaL-like domain